MPASTTYYDAFLCGLVPVKFLRWAPDTESGVKQVVVRVTRNSNRYYKAGEILTIWAYDFVVVTRRTKCSIYIATAPIPTTEEDS